MVSFVVVVVMGSRATICTWVSTVVPGSEFFVTCLPKIGRIVKKKLGSPKNSPNLFRRLISILLAAVGTSFFISLMLQLALLPLQLTYFDVVSIIGAWVNAFFLPLLSLCLPLAMIGSYVGLIWPNQPLSTLFMHPLDELFDLAFRWGTFLVAWPYSWVELQSTLSGSWILLVAICISSLYAVLVIWSNWIQQKSVDRLVKILRLGLYLCMSDRVMQVWFYCPMEKAY